MLLAIDIGNTAVKFGIFDDEALVSKTSFPTTEIQTPEDLDLAFDEVREHPVTVVYVCSVVPRLDDLIGEFCEKTIGVPPVFIDQAHDLGFAIRYETPVTLGADRLVAAFAAVQKYGVPVIACSFGTATTIDAVNSKNEYLGGVIAPGMKTMAEALHLRTAKLPNVEIAKPGTVFGSSTAASIRSGVYFGYLGLVEGILKRMAEELGETPVVVAGGGFAEVISSEIPAVAHVEKNLILDGLHLLHEQTQSA